jgi:hypothetical protein
MATCALAAWVIVPNFGNWPCVSFRRKKALLVCFSKFGTIWLRERQRSREKGRGARSAKIEIVATGGAML